MTNTEIIECQRREAEWHATELGRLFWVYERARDNAWSADLSQTASDKRMKQAWEKADAARDAFMIALRGFK